MNKNELCLKIAEEAGISQACAGRVLTILTREILNAWNWDVGAEFRISIKKPELRGLRP